MTNNLRQYLESNGISQYRLADLMGIKPQHVQHYVNSENMTTKTMNKIADALEVDVNELFSL